MQRTVTGQACEGSIEGDSRNAALFLSAGDFPCEATANVAFYVEGGQVLESFSGKHTGLVADAGQGLALFDTAIGATAAHFETSLEGYGNWDPDEGSFRDQVCGRFSQGATVDTAVSTVSIAIDDTDLVGTTGIASAW